MDHSELQSRTIGIFRDEFRCLATQYPSIYHERFISPLAVSKKGWRALADAIHKQNDSEWSTWYVAKNTEWLGHFYGSGTGFDEFRNTVGRLLDLFGVYPSSGEGASIWLGVLHRLAESVDGPLLTVDRLVWDWEPDDHIDSDDGSVADCEPYLQLWDERSTDDVKFPKHPLQQILSPNIFRASAIALEFLLTPEMVLWCPTVKPAERRVLLFEQDNDDHKVDELVEIINSGGVVELQISPDDEREEYEEWNYAGANETAANSSVDPLPDYQFQKSGDTWMIRFRTPNGHEEAMLKSTKGLEHYSKLLTAPHQTLTCMNIDLPTRSGKSLSAISETEALDQADQEGFSGFMEEGALRESVIDDEAVRSLAKAKNSLQGQIEYETNPEEKRRLGAELKQIEVQLKQRRRKLGDETQSGKAYRRVKKALADAQQKLRKEGMTALADHLQANIQRIGYGYRYGPTPTPTWKI